MKGRKPDGWSKGLSSTSSYGRKMPRKDRAKLVEQLNEQTQERARRVLRLLCAIWEPDEDDDETQDGADKQTDGQGTGGDS